MFEFLDFVYTPAGSIDPSLAICACRAGGVGVLNAELSGNVPRLLEALGHLATHAGGEYGLKVDAFAESLGTAAAAYAKRGLRWLIIDAAVLADYAGIIPKLRAAGTRILAEVTDAQWQESLTTPVDGLVIKGNESGGFVGEDSSFILLQKWLRQTHLPLFLRGGITPHVAAACAALGVAGGVLDSQLLLMDEVRIPEELRKLIGKLSGSETLAVGDPEQGIYFRHLVRPGLSTARQFSAECEGLSYSELRSRVLDRVTWSDPAQTLLPIGQDVAFAEPWRKQYGSVREVLKAINSAVAAQIKLAQHSRSITENAPLARVLGIRFPIIQGPMTRVSDTAPFALAVAEHGALPMVALAVLKGAALEELLQQCAAQLGERPWGIGLLGFAPQELLDEQLAVAARFKPTYAIIAGGRPDQALQLERAGVPCFLHVPAANLLPLFLQEGASRFIFEGRECGGHIGPLSSFVLWSTIVDRLLAELAVSKVRGEEINVIFAGGIHDDLSSAVLQIITAPLAAAGVKVGILMGSAYLFTREIVATGAIVEQFQKEVMECQRTVNLESGVGHASRCAHSPFAREFLRQRAVLKREGVPANESRRRLDALILGRLRIASKGLKRTGAEGRLQEVSVSQQHLEGMYMLGQVATLRNSLTDIETLHRQVTANASALIDMAIADAGTEPLPHSSAQPADIAIIGMACALPKANNLQEYWDNIIAKVDAITEIPAHRWDWRLYYDANRDATDKIYSKWGGFLNDLAFDPISYGMPPKSVEAVDPMQLMGLEIARRTLIDAGYHDRPFDRERASVIIGASGGIGDVGMQYGLRSELPRFAGSLPQDLAKRLPDWTEDSFAGILPNVAAGRIANRLNFCGMNLTTDAACASSLAAIYQGVTELMAGRSDFVIAGGLDTVQGPFGYLCFSKTQALSPRGKCSTFDVDGDGIVISEGVAMVALKRLADAERDGDRIYCLIKGVGSSSDGNAKGLTAPLPSGQLLAMRRAYAMAGFNPSCVGLFEAHGTGTVAGDTAEIESTTRLINEHTARPHQAVIGSVKTMIGHTKATAGIAGLIKAALALHRRTLPPHNNVTKPIAPLADEKAPLYLLDEAVPWFSHGTQPRRAACSAFGFGGTNFHAVLEEYTGEYRPWLEPVASNVWSAELLVWGASDHASLLSQIEGFETDHPVLNEVVLRDLAASLARSYKPGGHTLAIVAHNMTDLRAKLRLARARLRNELQDLPPGIHWGSCGMRSGKVAVLFAGQGSQYPNMAREAALHFPAVNAALAAAEETLGQAFATRFGPGHSLTRFIFPRGTYDNGAKAEARKQLASTDIAQPALGAVEAGLLHLLRSLGLKPDMFAGHSYGEFVALYAAGAIDFESLMKLSAARGRFIVDAAKAQGAELGTMAAVNAPRQIIEEAIADVEGVVLANHNAPLQSVISGTHAAIEKVSAKLRKISLDVTEIPVAAAFHSPLVKPAQHDLTAIIEATPWSATSVPVYSNTTARAHSGDPRIVKRQMAEHLVSPVEFVAEIEAMYADGARVFVEIGPKAILTHLVDRTLENRLHQAIAVDNGSGLAGLLGGIGELLCAGIEIDVNALFAARDCWIGNPAQPGSLSRQQPVPEHAWLLNGSSAHRAGTPREQVGVTFEQATIVSAATPFPGAPAILCAPEIPAAVAASSPSSATTTSVAPTVVTVTSQADFPKTLRRKDQPMDDRSPSESSVISEYFQTMRRFLETQERVMGAYLGGDSANRLPTRSKPLAVNSARAAELAAAPVVTPIAKAVAAPPIRAPAPPHPILQPLAAVRPAPTAAEAAVTAAPVPLAAAASTVAEHKPNGNGHGARLSRENLRDVLLAIVEEKTGYPRDILGLDQNLEADLGIDSIKRVEIIGAFQKFLPDSLREMLMKSGVKLNTQSTLNGMLDLLPLSASGGNVVRPFDSAGEGAKTDLISHPPRLIIRARPEALTASMKRRLTSGEFVLTRDALGVVDTLAASLRARGVTVHIVEADCLAAQNRLIELCARLRTSSIGGLVHLACLGAPALSSQQGPAEWRSILQVNEKSFFLLIRELGAGLSPAAHIVAASGLGGLFGREGSATGELHMQGGAPGALKSLLQERADLRVKSIDLDLTRNPAQLAGDLLAEIELDGGRQEVGYPAGRRTIFVTSGEGVEIEPAREQALKNLVVLATGGLRGITAEALRELAQPGNTLILTGRSTLAQTEDPETAQLADADALRGYFVTKLRTGVIKMTPADIERRVQSILRLREMRANLADFRAAGATAEYYEVDVTDEAALKVLIKEIRQRYQRIDGVVHGAGVIEDRLLAEKSSESWSRVVETKVLGLLLLQKLLDSRTLKFFTVFSSVAGRYGNSGQSDYATANELMNRLCVALRSRWGNSVAVKALCWGPWGPTRFGPGMVTPETEAKFKARRVFLVSAELGRQLFRQELATADGNHVEVICGQGPWEEEEMRRGVIRLAPGTAGLPQPQCVSGSAVIKPGTLRSAPA